LKKLATTAALGLFVLLLTGCAGTPEPAKESSKTPAAAAPRPDAAQAASLKTELAKIDPGIATVRAVNNAQQECRGILAGWPEKKLTETTKRMFAQRDPKSVSDDQANAIIEVIKTNGFCKA
jgi:hypothetical protein